jgi:hypothetical protein
VEVRQRLDNKLKSASLTLKEFDNIAMHIFRDFEKECMSCVYVLPW